MTLASSPLLRDCPKQQTMLEMMIPEEDCERPQSPNGEGKVLDSPQALDKSIVYVETCSEKEGVAQTVSQTVNVLDHRWKLRPNRDEPGTDSSKLSTWRRVVAYVLSDIGFAFGKFGGGGFVGPPHSVFQMYNDFLEILPTQSPSEGFESSCADGADMKLDPSLQQISKRMKEILRGIEGRARMSAVRFLAWALSKVWRMLFNKVHVDVEGVERINNELEAAARSGKSVMLLPTHRSHIDYLLMSYVCFGFNLPVPHIASGDNLNIPVIGTLFAYSGAFFLRRTFKGDNLYKKVLYGYLLRKLREGSLIECFVEGGRSRTGMISDPKVGIILTAVRFVRDGSLKDVVLLPASIDYERTVETSSHVDQLLGKKKRSESLFGAVKSGLRAISGTKSHGDVFVNFSDGVSVREVIEEVERPLRRSGKVRSELYLPEEVYVNAVAQAVVNKQRSVSYISAAALTAATLLCTSNEPQIDMNSLSDLFTFFLTLSVRAGANTLSLKDVKEGILKPSELIGRASDVLLPVLEISTVKGSADKEDVGVSDEYIEAIAKQRLRLRYQCGQLVPVLTPFAIVATALYSSTSGITGTAVKPEFLFKSASTVAEMVRHAIPGALTDASSLKSSMQHLIDMEIASIDANGCITLGPRSDAMERNLRALRLLIAPSINACCACLSAVASLCQSSQIDQNELTKRARDVVYASVRKEVTDWASQSAGRSKNRNGLELAPAVGFPESLSIMEIKSAIKSLISIGVFTSVTSNGSGVNLPPTHSPNSSLSTPSSHMSLISVASSKTFGSSEVDASEKKSLGSSSETQSAANGSDKEQQGTHLEISSSYLRGDGIKLLEKLSSLQRFLYREDVTVNNLRVKKSQSIKSPPVSLLDSMPSVGSVLLFSGLLYPLIRSWRQTGSLVK